MTEKLTIPGEDGEPDRWVNLRSHNQRFKAGERRMLYEFVDTVNAQSPSGSLSLLRRIIAHIVESWYLEVSPPRVVWKDGVLVGYENLESLDELDTDVEDELLIEAKWWMDKIAINFGPSPDKESPTKPSDD
jgi:hypothetical protein